MLSQTSAQTFFAEANDYYKVSLGGMKRKNIFTNEILYNLISLSLEKYIMGFLAARHYMAECHTLKGMLTDLNKFIPVSAALMSKVIHFDQIQQICSLDNYSRTVVSDEDIADMMSFLTSIKGLVLEKMVV